MNVNPIVEVMKILLYPGFVFTLALALSYEWFDRKVYARLQNRVGPLYTGPSGFLQPLADIIKLLSKEDITPRGSDRPFFILMPVMALATMLTGVTLLPIMSTTGLISFEGDVVLAIALMTIFCIIVFLSGAFSMNRFSFIGAERAVSQLLGYEIPLTLAVMGVALSAGSLRLTDIVYAQTSWWFILGPHAIGFVIFLIAGQAELEKIPFDIPEAEQEIVAGWLTEFSGKKLALFRLSADVELVFISGLAATLFLGGPSGPIINGLEFILHPVYFVIKTLVVLFLLSFTRTLFARVRIDQMVSFSWKYLIPLSLLLLLLIRIIV